MQEMKRFIEIVRKLRSEDGCPWDRAQTHLSLRKCLVEESGEFLDAVEAMDYNAMKEELGDLLLQVVLHAQIAEEKGKFNFEDVAQAANEKLVRRHTHVFAEKKADSAEEALMNWEESKKAEKGAQQERKSLMDGIPRSFPALSRAQKTLGKAEKLGFKWQSEKQMLAKLEEEWQEISQALKENNKENLAEESGDFLLAFVSFCRYYSIEAEESLQEAIAKFMLRFRSMEKMYKELDKDNLDDIPSCLMKLWKRSKGLGIRD